MIEKTSISEEVMFLESRYGAHNYHPLPVVLSLGEGVFVWDVEGKKYFDFLAAYSAVNQGHRHPKIIAALIEQASKITLTSRAFYNDSLGNYEKYITQYFGYDKVLPMNTGVEAVETAVKLARRWGYSVKGIAENQAKIVWVENNFHGRTLSSISASTDPTSYGGFGPFLPGYVIIPFNDLDALEHALIDPNVCAFIFEPIQGEGGVNIPAPDYINQLRQLCDQYDLLLMLDEIQTGIGRTGKFLAFQHNNIIPDVCTLAKALGNGVPIGACLARGKAAKLLTAGTHGSTFGGNPLACSAALAVLATLDEKKLINSATQKGELIRLGLTELLKTNSHVVDIRNKGLMIGIELDKPCAELVHLALQQRLLINVTNETTIRLLPPLIIDELQIKLLVETLSGIINDYTELAA